mmetsp:Transcript_5909/g.22336  ORF Transcript_5909/g.22336 Transcript_5909/m.22336 type:complete len:270 (+) Transcript_5909:2304-3113(+)
MRCSALLKWLRTRIFTEGDPLHVRFGGLGSGTGGTVCARSRGSFATISARLALASASALSRAGSGKFSVGSAVCDRGSNLHLTPMSAACSSGSPKVLPSTCTSEWQPATTSDADLVASGHGVSSVNEPSSLGVTMPMTTSLSEVRVPVLSNRVVSTLPEMGTLKGSVQKTDARMSAMRAVLTAIAVCIGSSGGTTLVRMRMHRSTSSYCDRLPSFMPMTNTLPDATQAKTNRMKSNTKVSQVSPVTCSLLNSIMRINLPCVDENPVWST